MFSKFAKRIGRSRARLTRGKSIALSALQIDRRKSIDNMAKKKTLEQIKNEFCVIWGDTYNYDLITEDNYKGVNYKVPIICKIHGVFWQKVEHHLNGHACKRCASSKPKISSRKIIPGGYFDMPISMSFDKKVKKLTTVWRCMLERCNGTKTKELHETYKGCFVCDDWLLFSNFYNWATNPENGYKFGYHLDKDIIVQGNKLYSPQTCCFVPQEINKIIVKSDYSRSNHQIGVSLQRTGKYLAYFSIDSKRHVIGTFDTMEQASLAYKKAKEEHIQRTATKYFNNGKITKRVYESLMKYEVCKQC